MTQTLKIASWNVNGLRAVAKKGFTQWLMESGFDIVCLQEAKVQEDQLDPSITNILGYSQFVLNAAERKGYSGVANYFKTQAEDIKLGFDLQRITELETMPQEIDKILAGKTTTDIKYSQQKLKPTKLTEQIKAFNSEGRIIESWHGLGSGENFVLFNIYFPNGGASTERLKFKLEFYEAFLAYLTIIKKENPYIVITGDYNTAHKEIDLARPKENTNISGFMNIEKIYLDKLESQGFIDTYRHIHGNKPDVYTWWSFRTAARSRNVGWRIDYFYISQELIPMLKSATVHAEIEGSDHCPISIELETR